MRAADKRHRSLLRRWQIAVRIVAVVVGAVGALFARSAWATLGIFIVQDASLRFGSIVIGAMAGTVTISPAGMRTSTGGALLGQTGGSSAASFTVSGEPNTSYSIALPNSALLSGPDQDMTFDTFTISTAGNGLLGPGGSQVFSVGATLHVNANQAHGAYAGSLPVTVTYE
jgi:hypothetical protein